MADYSGGNVTAHIGADISDYQSAMRSLSNVTQSAMKGASNSTQGTTSKIGELTSSIGRIAAGVGVFALVSNGVNLIRDSVGSAVSRFDTLNAYPKVMKQMGYSTQDTNKSVGILKKGVDGLPTSLQDLTKSAQSFAILEKSATKGAQTATALNDAFLASGASAGDASRGVQQYSQMLATGKVDLQSWRTLQETMPYALTKVANSFGLTGKSAERDLYAKLQAGEITMDQLNQRFVELDGGLNGFANTARTATGGIGTSFTNMRNAVVNGLANTITAIDNGLRNAGIQNGIAGIFNQVKQVIITSFAGINRVVQASIPVIIGIFKQVYPVIKNIAPLIAGLGGGFITASVGVTAFTKAASGVSSVLGAIYKHPVVAMIVLLATAFYEAYVNIKPFHDFVDKVAKKLGDLVTQVTSTKGGMDGLKVTLGALGGAAGLGVVIAGIIKFKNSLSMMTTPMSIAGSGLSNIGKSAGGVSVKLLSIATAVLEIGVGIGAATAGIGLMAMGFASLASTGNAGLLVILSMSVAIVAVAGAFALLGPILTAGAVGIGVFGAAMLAIGVGIGIASAGLALLATQLPIISQYGTSAAVGLLALSGAIALFGAGALVASVGLVALSVGFVAFGVSLVAVTLGVTALAIGVGLLGAAMLIVSTATLLFGTGLLVVGAALPAIATSGTSAALSLTALGLASTVVAAGLLVLGAGLLAAGAGAAVFGAGALVASAGGAVLAGAITLIAGSIAILAASIAMLGRSFVTLAGGMTALAATVSSIFSGISSFISRTMSSIANTVRGAWNGISSTISSMARSAINGLKGAWSGLTGLVSGIWNGVKGAIKSAMNFDLGAAGRAIMDSFLGGLKRAWEGVKSFVGGIADWIKAHKGPISYDRKLLIPAGKAIMDGFGSSLNANFATVKQSVSSYARQISDEFGKQEYVANAQLTTSSAGVAGQINGGLSALSDKVAEQQTQAPIFQVFNEIIGDKITTTVNTKNARRQATVQLMSGGV